MFLPHGYDGQGPGTFLGPPGALPPALRRGQHAGVRAEHARADVPPPAAPDAAALPAPAHRHDAQEPVAPPPRDLAPQRAHRAADFELLIDEVDPIDPAQVTRLVLCSRARSTTTSWSNGASMRLDHIAIVRVEQLYPFPEDEIKAVIARYPKAHDICWTQEEPRNQGIWFFMLSRRHLAGLVGKHHRLSYAGRDLLRLPCRRLSERAPRRAARAGDALRSRSMRRVQSRRLSA